MPFGTKHFLRKERVNGKVLCKLAEDIREYYYKDHRMSPERFEHCFNLVAPTVTKKRHKLQKL